MNNNRHRNVASPISEINKSNNNNNNSKVNNASPSFQESERIVLEISALRSVVAPVTERFCSVETKVKQLLSRVHGFQRLAATKGGIQHRRRAAGGDGNENNNNRDFDNENNFNNDDDNENTFEGNLRGAELSMAARVTIGIYGPPKSGKSSLVSALVGCPNLVPEGTTVPLIVVPTVHDATPCMRLPDGKAVAAGEGPVRKLIQERNEAYASLSNQYDESPGENDDLGSSTGNNTNASTSHDHDRFAEDINKKSQDEQNKFFSKNRKIQQLRSERQRQLLLDSRLHLNMSDFFVFDRNNESSPAVQRRAAIMNSDYNSNDSSFPHHKKSAVSSIMNDHLLPLTGETMPWLLVDHPPTDNATKVRFSSAALNSISPVEFLDDIVFYVVDARMLGTSKEVDLFDNLLFLHPEEKSQLQAASNFKKSKSTKRKSKDYDNDPAKVEHIDEDGEDNEENLTSIERKRRRQRILQKNLSPFVSNPATRKRLLTSTYFFLSHIDAFPDSEIVLSRGESLDMASAQIYDEHWSATHGQASEGSVPPACRTAEFALRRFAMLAEFVFGMPVPASHMIAVSSVGIAHSKVVLQRRNINCVADEDDDAAKLSRALEEEMIRLMEQQNCVGGILSHKSKQQQQQQQQQKSSQEGSSNHFYSSGARSILQMSADTSSGNPNNNTENTTSSLSPSSSSITLSANSPHTKLKLFESQDELVSSMYKFAQWFLGPKFMVRADHLPYHELRRIAANFARYRSALTSGGRALDSLLTVILSNLASHFFLSVANSAAEITESLEAARVMGDKTIAAELENARESESVLTDELEWVRDQIAKIQREARAIPERASRQLHDRLGRFRDVWLEELRDIFLRRPLEWFKSRQIATIRDIQASLVRYDDFSESFSSHNRYLHTLMLNSNNSNNNNNQNGIFSSVPSSASLIEVGMSPASNRNISYSASNVLSPIDNNNNSNLSLVNNQNQNNKNNNTYLRLLTSNSKAGKFIRNNLQQLYSAAIKSRAERFDEVNTCIAHHLRDELHEFVRDLQRNNSREQADMLRDFAKFCRIPVADAKERLAISSEQEQNNYYALMMNGNDNNMNNVSLGGSATWLHDFRIDVDVQGCEVVQEDRRLLNNFCREVVEPVTAAQAELILLEQEEEDHKNEIVDKEKELFQQAGVVGTRSSFNNNSIVSAGSAKSALEHLRQVKNEATQRKQDQQDERDRIKKAYDETGSYGKSYLALINCKTKNENSNAAPPPILHRFMIDAWQLALFSLKVEQIASFDLEPFIARIATFTATAVDAMADFSQTLSLGIEEHGSIVLELEQDQEALEALKKSLPRVHRAIAVESCARYTSDIGAPNIDPRVVALQKRLGMV